MLPARTGSQDRIDVVITGGDGCVATLLRAAWRLCPPPFTPLWTSRRSGLDLIWDLGHGPAPRLPKGAVILHLAGTIRPVDRNFEVNIAMIPPLIDACRRNEAAAILLASSASVYAPGPLPAAEGDVPRPISAYGESKLAAEWLALRDPMAFPVTCLRIGNVIGADALFGPRQGDAPIRLDPVPGREGGPVRSWIGPLTLAATIARLCQLVATGQDLPRILNVASSPPLAMGALLEVSGREWAYGPANPDVVPDAVMDTSQLEILCPLPAATPGALLAELEAVKGRRA